MRQIKKDGRLPQDKMTTLAAILFIPGIIVFALVYKGLSGWRADIQYEKEAMEREQFVTDIYAPLASSQKSLVSEFSKMQKRLQASGDMQLTYPNHAELVQSVSNQWREGQRSLYFVHDETDKEVRFAWIAHNRLDQQDVLTKFSKKAVLLESKIKQSERDYQLKIVNSQSDLIRGLDSARLLLASFRSPPKSKKQRLLNQALREKIRPFNDRTKSDLLDYLETIDPRLKTEMESFQILIQMAAQQSVVLDKHLIKNPDLEKPLSIIINKWKALEQASQEYLKFILYAVEAEAVAVKLGLPQKNPAIQAMHKSLRLNIPAIVGKGLKQRKVIDQSYKINRS
jgi:hypothetical protein